MSELSDAQCDRIIAAVKGLDVRTKTWRRANGKHDRVKVRVPRGAWPVRGVIPVIHAGMWKLVPADALGSAIQPYELQFGMGVTSFAQSVRTNWPPPARGTHSSDLPACDCPCISTDFDYLGAGYTAHHTEYLDALRWSHTALHGLPAPDVPKTVQHRTHSHTGTNGGNTA